MKSVYVRILADLHCDWEGYPPDYRVYVNDEMFVERAYKWSEPVYLTEILKINGKLGETYTVRLEPVPPQLATFCFKNPRVGKCDYPVKMDKQTDTEFTFTVTK